MARIGPNSPAAPAPMNLRPNSVVSTPRSRSTGSSVPNAVLVRQMATPTKSETTFSSMSRADTPRARMKESTHPMPARRPPSPSHRIALELVAREEEQQAETELVEGVDRLVHLDQAEHLRPHEDAEAEQQHHLGDAEPQQPDGQRHQGGACRDDEQHRRG